MPIKNNLARDTKGVAYHIQSWGIIEGDQEIKTSRIEWEDEELMENTDEILRKEHKKMKDSGERILEAQSWLIQKLTEVPEGIPLSELRIMAEERGINERMIYRAKKETNVYSEKIPGSVHNDKKWRILPAQG